MILNMQIQMVLYLRFSIQRDKPCKAT